MQHIEVLGIQGSGKTTLIRLIKKVFIQNGKNVFDHMDLMAAYYRKKYSILNFIYFKFFSNLVDFILLRLFLLRSVHKRFQIDFIKNNQSFFCYIISNHRKTLTDNEINDRIFEQVIMTYGFFNLAQKILDSSDILLLDEGICYRPISLFVSEDKILEYEQIKTYFELIGLPQVIFYIKPNIEKSIERMKIRGFPKRIENKSMATKIQYLKNVERSLQIILSYLKSNDIYIFEIKNEHENNFKEKLTAKLNKILDQNLN